MAQTYADAPSTEKIRESRPKLLQRDDTILSCFSGTAFPTSPAPVEGQLCRRTDLNVLFQYSGTAWEALLFMGAGALVFPTVTAARAYDYAAIAPDGLQVVLTGDAAAGDRGVRSFRWDAGSTATHDGELVLRPTVGAADTGAGRLLFVGAADAHAAAAIASFTALRAKTWKGAARPPALFVANGHATGVGGGLFELDASDTSTADDAGLTIVDAAGNRWKRWREPYVRPEDFGARGDGTTDDTAAWAAALASGRLVSGDRRRVYAVTGNLALPDITDVREAIFKQLSPNNAGRRTLYFDGGSLCRLIGVGVDRNGNGLNGTIGDAAAAWIANCDRVEIDDFEAYGNDIGNGLAIVDCNGPRIRRPYIHDMRHGDSASANPGDDRINGVWLVRGEGAQIVDLRIKNLRGQWTSQAAIARYTRGLAVSGAASVSVIGGDVDVVDQGVDITGSDNPRRIVVQGVHARNCWTWGFKAANTATEVTLDGVHAYRCGLAGVAISGNGAALTPYTGRVIVKNSQFIETGHGGNWDASDPAGVKIFTAGSPAGNPQSVLIEGNVFAGGTKMKYAVDSDVVRSADGDVWVEEKNNIVRDVTAARSRGVHQGYVRRLRSTAQSIAHDTVTKVSWDQSAVDRFGSGTANPWELRIPRAGLWQVQAFLEFASNANNIRSMRALLGSGLVGLNFIPANATSTTQMQVMGQFAAEPGDILEIDCYQNSGSSLNVTGFVIVMQIEHGRGRT
ncbi:MAG: hypothetical protein NW200_04760 [Hyphomonadaceae bacterium]|nr:hypothetical protein [Hyphomonadaceae bacterium]